jgi:hypothetical protein
MADPGEQMNVADALVDEQDDTARDQHGQPGEDSDPQRPPPHQAHALKAQAFSDPATPESMANRAWRLRARPLRGGAPEPF